MAMISPEAWQLAHRLHAGQTDRAGAPYFHHLTWVWKGVLALGGSEAEQVAAWLHDAVEDGHTTLEELRAEGVSEASLMMIDALTKRPGEHWRKNLERIIAAGPGTCRVKIADLLHNTRHDRVAALVEIEGPERVEARMERYRKSLEILMAELGLIEGREEE